MKKQSDRALAFDLASQPELVIAALAGGFMLVQKQTREKESCKHAKEAIER
jgi:hypothetical protein